MGTTYRKGVLHVFLLGTLCHQLDAGKGRTPFHPCGHAGSDVAGIDVYCKTSLHIALSVRQLSDGSLSVTNTDPSLQGKSYAIRAVTEDGRRVKVMIIALLAELGYEVRLARDGAEAVEIYAMARKQRQSFDVVIMDLVVPGGVGGREAAGRLREIDADARIVVSSGYSDDSVMASFREHGFSAVMTKPFELSTMSRTLSEVAGVLPES